MVGATGAGVVERGGRGLKVREDELAGRVGQGYSILDIYWHTTDYSLRTLCSHLSIDDEILVFSSAHHHHHHHVWL